MATPVFGESNTVGGGTAYRYITAAYCRQAAAGPAFAYFCGISYNKGYGAAQAGSLVSVSFTGNFSPAASTDIQIYKNLTKWFTPISGLNVATGSNPTTAFVNYPIGTNTYAAGDIFDVYLTSTSGGLYFGVTLLFAEPGP